MRIATIKAFLAHTTYRKEITLVIALKLCALILLWGFCFSHPPGKVIIRQTIGERLLG